MNTHVVRQFWRDRYHWSKRREQWRRRDRKGLLGILLRRPTISQDKGWHL